MGDRNIPRRRDGRRSRRSYRTVQMLIRYPDGLTGLALLLLRLSSALVPFAVFRGAVATQLNWWVGAATAALLSVMLVAGFGTRFAAGLLALMLILPIYVAAGATQLLMLAAAAAAAGLLLLGPGAYSLDARLFGRRVIRLDVRSPDRGSID